MSTVSPKCLNVVFNFVMGALLQCTGVWGNPVGITPNTPVHTGLPKMMKKGQKSTIFENFGKRNIRVKKAGLAPLLIPTSTTFGATLSHREGSKCLENALLWAIIRNDKHKTKIRKND